MMALSMEQAEKDMRRAVEYLSAHEAFSGGGVAAVGFCLGGGLAIRSAATTHQVRAAVTYYYVMPHGKPDFSHIRAAVLGHLGASDEFVPVEAAQALEAELRDAGVRALRVLPGASTHSSTTATGSGLRRPGARSARGRAQSSSCARNSSVERTSLLRRC